MILPLQITFRNLEHSDRIERSIREEAAGLDKFHGRIVSCRVVVEAPERHHKRGNMHHVRIGLGLPGGALVIKAEPSLHGSIRQVGEERVSKHLEVQAPHQDVELAIRDAFRAARRRLEDYARRQRGEVKAHESQRAQVFEVFPEEGYGFLETSDGRQIYFHKNSVMGGRFGRMKVGNTVCFAEEQGEHGPQASTVRIIR